MCEEEVSSEVRGPLHGSSWFNNPWVQRIIGGTQRFSQWWSTDPFYEEGPRWTIPDIPDAIGIISSAIAGAFFDSAGPYVSTIKRQFIGNVDGESRLVSFFPNLGRHSESMQVFRKLADGIGRVGATFAVLSLGTSIGHTWTANSGNTNGQRVIKTGVQIVQFGLAYSTGKVSAKLIGAAAATGNPKLTAGAAIIALGGSFAINYQISQLADRVFELFDIS